MLLTARRDIEWGGVEYYAGESNRTLVAGAVKKIRHSDLFPHSLGAGNQPSAGFLRFLSLYFDRHFTIAHDCAR